MKHFYCGRLTEVVLEDLDKDTTAWNLQGVDEVQTLVIVHTADVTDDVLTQAHENHPTARKLLITTLEDAQYDGWESIVVPMLTLPLIHSVLEG